MASLETYLRGPHREDGEFLRRLLNTIDEVIPIFYKQTGVATVKNRDCASEVLSLTTWPYAVSENGVSPPPASRLSASTHCMILFALDAFIPRDEKHYSVLLGPRFRPGKLLGPTTDTNELQKVIDTAGNALIAALKNQDQKDALVESGTYGRNDPFTLTWLTEILFRWRGGVSKASPVDETVLKAVLKAVDNALDRPSILDPEGAEGRFCEVTGSFLKVRRLHLAKAAVRLAKESTVDSKAMEWLKKTEVWREFDSTVHRQLSYSAMGDPKFDPAELAFAFEGALLLHSYWISRTTVDQVFKALTISRERQPFWRPVTPFLANDRGQVLFLVSVEVANSILRSCEILDQNEAVPARFAQIEPQLRTYATWLLGEVEKISDMSSPTGKNLVGWRTEYGDQRGTIHLWHTSHVLLFLAHYESLLKRKIGADGVEAAGLIVRVPKEIKNFWDDEPLRELAGKGEKQYAVLSRMKEQYIKPRRILGKDHSAPQSVLLYGPPGTGKTTVAEQLAIQLARPLIVITVSDFLAAGSAELENRAKGVFEVLRSQEGVVVLFDEIDQFLLDRNSGFYQQQSDVFKFMTPGMLTKLQDLRDDDGSVFIVATNYYERVDSAIKRRGRIDNHLLLCLPDKAQRLKLLSRFVHKLFERKLEDEATHANYKAAAGTIGPTFEFFDAVTTAGGFPSGTFEKGVANTKLAEMTVHFGWGDLKGLVELTTGIHAGMTFESLAAALQTAANTVEPAVNLGAYVNRFEGNGPYPYEEFFLLVYLITECRNEFTDSEEVAITTVLKTIPGLRSNPFEDLLNERGIKEQALVQELATNLKSYIK